MLNWLALGCLTLYFGGVIIGGFNARASLAGWREAGLIAGLIGGGGYVFNSFYGNRHGEQVLQVGVIGALLLIATTFARWLLPDASWLDQVRLLFAYPLCIAPLLYWLYRRFSNVPPAWAESSLTSVAVLLTVGGLTLLVGTTTDSNAIKIACAGLGSVCYLVVGAHGFRALSDRNQNRVMSAPWSALCLILLVAGGLLSAVMALPDAMIWSQNTALESMPNELISSAVLALILAVGNQSAAEMRGENRRVTGWVPFWLATGGFLLMALGMSAVGLVESVLIRLEVAEIEEWIAPLRAIWRSGTGLVTAGLAVYALTYFLRRPRSTTAPDYRRRR